jgi:S1-C subfamily serine protease
MDIAGTITKYIISGIISFSSIFNPAIGEKISSAPTPQVAKLVEKKTIEQFYPLSTINLEEPSAPQPATKKATSTPAKNNQNRKLNVATIQKTTQIQVGVPILPLKEIFSTTTITQVQKTKEVAKPQEKNIFDIINTIPTFTPSAQKPSSSPITRVQNSIGNVFCTTQNGNSVSVVTGSAVIVNSLGVAVTNAHVAQYPLIEKYFKANQGKTMNCFGRIGSPATGNYKIDILYISPNWVRKNARNIVDPNFRETGEDDLAIIRFVPSTSKTFTHTNISEDNLRATSPIYIGSYPALELRQKGINSALYGRYEQNTIRQIDYYVSSKPIFETEQSSMGQAGSSGGGIFDSAGNLAGTIALIIQNSNTSNPYIRGLTISHINKTLAESGTSLDHYITGNPDVIENNFSKTATELESILMQQLSSSR